MRINKEYCVTCGGLRSYEEDDLTQTASSTKTRIQAYPSTVNVVTGGALTFNDAERVCGCQRNAAQ